MPCPNSGSPFGPRTQFSSACAQDFNSPSVCFLSSHSLGPNPFNQSSLRALTGLQSRWERDQHSPHPPCSPRVGQFRDKDPTCKVLGRQIAGFWDQVHRGLQQFPQCLIAGASLHQSQVKEENDVVVANVPHIMY